MFLYDINIDEAEKIADTVIAFFVNQDKDNQPELNVILTEVTSRIIGDITVSKIRDEVIYICDFFGTTNIKDLCFQIKQDNKIHEIEDNIEAERNRYMLGRQLDMMYALNTNNKEEIFRNSRVSFNNREYVYNFDL